MSWCDDRNPLMYLVTSLFPFLHFPSLKTSWKIPNHLQIEDAKIRITAIKIITIFHEKNSKKKKKLIFWMFFIFSFPFLVTIRYRLMWVSKSGLKLGWRIWKITVRNQEILFSSLLDPQKKKPAQNF